MPSKLMLDTGASYHVMDSKVVRRPKERIKQSIDGKRVSTANGLVTLDREVETNVLSLQEVLNAYVQDNTPTLLSVGKLCRVVGCEMSWKPYAENPSFGAKDGREMKVWCEHDVPFLDPVTPLACNPVRTATKRRCYGHSAPLAEKLAPVDKESSSVGAPPMVTHPPLDTPKSNKENTTTNS